MRATWNYRIGKLGSAIIGLAGRCNVQLPPGLSFTSDLKRFLTKPVELVIDAGANRGETVAEYLKAYPDCQIHALEPVKSNFHALQHRYQKNHKVTIYPLALGAASEERDIHLSNNHECHSFVRRESAQSPVETVQLTTLDEFMLDNDIDKADLLKIDVEGFEVPLLQGAESAMAQRKILSVLVEVAFDSNTKNKTRFVDVDAILSARGYVFSGFYQFFRWGSRKEKAGFANGLWMLSPSE